MLESMLSPTSIEVPRSEPQGSNIRVLLIEDDPGYADLIKTGLSKARAPTFEVRWVETLKGGVESLAKGAADIVLLDLFLPDSHGIASLTHIRAQAPFVPVIILTACVDDSLELEALQKGAQDYLDKAQVHAKMLSRVIRYAIEREQAERALRESQERLKQEKEEAERLARALKQTLEELKATQQAVLEREKALSTGELAAVVAHEIRNPLSIISIAIQYLQSQFDLKDSRQTFTKAIVKKIEQLDRISKRLVSLGAPLGMRQLRNLNRSLDRSLELFKVRCRSQQIKVIRRYAERLSLVSIDCEQMEQVFTNLLTNALDAMSHGGQLTLSTRHDPEQRTVNMAITDTGPGIPKKLLQQLFTPFVTTKKAKGGTGLGLAICHRIISQHGGKIEVASSTAKRTHGTTFTVVLPTPPPSARDES
ncbi:MAG: response regulator [Elusimicrobia bacterium]|nr:response regulator [Elusimicrobiota bacterium]